jgi:hypothetical protein
MTKLRNGEKALWVRRNGERVPVKVMVRCEGWAMVRRRNAMPFACQEKDLEPMEKANHET